LKSYSDVLVGLEKADDAGVYRLTPDIALVQTIDVITPVVDDPFSFGQIAAANSLSDVYAMGGRPVTAMSYVGFPLDGADIDVLRRILAGALSKLDEAGCALVGGHSVKDTEIKFGLSVTGVVHPDRVLTKGGVRPGDRLILTKPIGTGILNTALKADLLDAASVAMVMDHMKMLNRAAAEVMVESGAGAATDITGFGLVGHAAEMAALSQVGLNISFSRIPTMPGARQWAEAGLVPGGAYSNREYRLDILDAPMPLEEWMLDILFDPQTSGGLLIAVPADAADTMVERIREKGCEFVADIGEAVVGNAGRIIISE
jgi:selenide,water dikinase